MPNCFNCNKPITSTNGIKFCSNSCATTFNNKRRSSDIKCGPEKGIGAYTKIKFLTCEICLTPFTWNSITKGSTRHCSNPVCFKQFRYNCLKGRTGGFRKNSTRKTRSIYNGYQMDSGSELTFAQLLDANNIKWIKNSTTWFEYLPGKKYYPDFYLEEFNQWIEIKSKYYLRADDNLRWQAVPNLEVIWSNNIKLPSCI